MKKELIIFAYFISLTITSCQSRFLDNSGQQISMSIIPPVEGYIFNSSVWLSDDTIVFTVDDSERKTPDPFLVFNLVNQTWNEIIVSSNSNCQVAGFGFLEKLPNGNIGFVDTCITDGIETRTIGQIDIYTAKITTLLDSGPIKVAGKFSFSPDMTELIQEDMTGRFLTNKLFYRKDDEFSQIVPDFTRAMYPDWSPQKRQIAFWGTESYSGGEPDDFSTLPEILGLSSYSWDLYISTPDGMNVKMFFSEVDDALLIKWSPTEEKIAFSGIIDRESGVFILDLNSLEVQRIWPNLSDFDWSPDGNKIVVVNNEKNIDGKIVEQDVNIIYLK